ncbi:MAG: hypothetical protein ACYDCO_11135 [Armatimonadota bacterium]
MTGLRPAVVILACLVALFFLGMFLVKRGMIFDDSFISYRYAKNLAFGHGITWNPREAPVEGYTNFLLVVVLAPCIKLGIDPLAATRFFSLLAGLGIAYLLFTSAKKMYGASGSVAALVALSFLLISKTHNLITVGLETVLFGAALFGAFLLGCRYLESDKARDAGWFGAAAFAAFLLRPEAVFLVIAFAAVILFRGLTSPGRAKVITVPAGAVGLTFLLPLAGYLLWKYLHFGDILPNPYYIKAAASQLVSQLGMETVRIFLGQFAALLIAALVSFRLANGDRGQRAMAAIAVALYLLFYLHVEPLMDIFGRFLYPAGILLAFLAMPALVVAFRFLESLRWHALLKSGLACLLVVGAFNWKAPVETYLSLANTEAAARFTLSQNTLMQREAQIGKALGRYPGIDSIRIAFGDAGVIPYYSGALHLDVVGLNDRVIAREKDRQKLVGYFFNQQPDLVLQPADISGPWVDYGHGPLGNYASWANDPRWDRYAYIGSIGTGPPYNLHMLLRRDLPGFTNFAAFLRSEVADGIFSELPLPLGSYRPSGKEILWYQVRPQ